MVYAGHRRFPKLEITHEVSSRFRVSLLKELKAKVFQVILLAKACLLCMVNYWGAQTEIKTKNSLFYMYLGHSQQVTVFSVDVCFDCHTVTKGPHVVVLLSVVPWWQHYVLI